MTTVFFFTRAKVRKKIEKTRLFKHINPKEEFFNALLTKLL